jgi:Arc/MetJ-type ribon-helix-helix transcriptional regulator
MKTISVNLPRGLVEAVEAAVKKDFYPHMSELIRDSVRGKLIELGLLGGA